MSAARPLRKITRDDLAPIWARRDIPVHRVAAALGVTRSAVCFKAKTLGLPSRAPDSDFGKKVSDAEFKRLWLAKVRSLDIAELCGYTSYQAVSYRRRALGLPPRKVGQQPKNSREATITLSQYREMQLAKLMKDELR